MWWTKLISQIKKFALRKTIDDSIASLANCPQCTRPMQFDLICKDGLAVNANQIKPVDPPMIAGYGFYCVACERGWTGDALRELHVQRQQRK